MRVKLTDRFVKSAATGGRKSPIFMDDEVIGFGVQVRDARLQMLWDNLSCVGTEALARFGVGV